MPNYPLTIFLRDFVSTLVREHDVDDALQQLCVAATSIVGVSGAGLSVADATGQLRVVAASDETVLHMEAIEEHLQEGPCVTAFRTGQPVTATGEQMAQLWPAFSRSAFAAGMAFAGGFPMSIDDRLIGSLNLYGRDPVELEPLDLENALTMAQVATVYLLLVRSQRDAADTVTQLQHALDARIIVEQAKGMIAAQHDESIAAALERLRGWARSSNQKLQTVALAIVNGELRI